jgi:NADH-quinone oxidoreductase subunit N
MVHIGFIIYSLSIYNIDGVASSFFYLLFYITLIFFLFTFILLLHEKNINNSLFLIENISQLGLIFNKNKILAILLSFILLSLAGLPFFVGFISK